MSVQMPKKNRFRLPVFMFACVVIPIGSLIYFLTPSSNAWTNTSSIAGIYKYVAGHQNIQANSHIGDVAVVCAVTFYGYGRECPSFTQIQGKAVQAQIVEINSLFGIAVVVFEIKSMDVNPDFYWSQPIGQLREGWFVRSILAGLLASIALTALMLINFTQYFSKENS
jgi:hypothetical protein